MTKTFSKPHTCFVVAGSWFLPFFLLLVVAAACQQQTTSKEAPPTVRDKTITQQNAYSDLFFDSLRLEKLITERKVPDSVAKRLRNFYNSRNYQYAWFTNEGFNEQAQIFWNLQSDYLRYSGDSLLYNPALQHLMDSAETTDYQIQLPDSLRFATEMQLTRQFVRYARRAYQGNIEIGNKHLDWFIPRKRLNIVAVLDSFLKNKEPYEPVNAQYGLLKKFLLRYYDMQQHGGWPAINSTAKKFQLGDSMPAIASIKKRLFTTGDYTLPDTSYLFTDSLKAAVQRFQKRYGLNEDGVIGGGTLKALNEPIEQRIRQILINMERMRWIPAQPPGDFILVNIPQFRLLVFEQGKPAFAMNIVVGKEQHETVIFTGTIKYVVFSPYWNVPPSILKNEIAPAMRRDPAYLAKHNMERNGNGVRQKPGPGNALGKVKFLFPNSYNIYLHDSPAKSLFGETKRTFSHGCIRVAEPEKLANWILRKQPAWTAQRINTAMNANKEQYVTVTNPISVFIGYFTAYVDTNGQLNFRNDIYGHDKKLAEHLFAR